MYFYVNRIESEDQLDTAKKPGDRDENNKEDEDCKESNGIDMSEDFESKLQDIEKRGDDSSEDEQSDNEELDKEMGETEQGAEKYVLDSREMTCHVKHLINIFVNFL